VTVVPQNFDWVTATTPEDVEIARMRVALLRFLDLRQGRRTHMLVNDHATAATHHNLHLPAGNAAAPSSSETVRPHGQMPAGSKLVPPPSLPPVRMPPDHCQP
jgi:hypothetical protein